VQTNISTKLVNKNYQKLNEEIQIIVLEKRMFYQQFEFIGDIKIETRVLQRTVVIIKVSIRRIKLLKVLSKYYSNNRVKTKCFRQYLL
jgi:hypothetical protein